MTAGIGALIVGGIAAKKIADFTLSGDDDEQIKQNKLIQNAKTEMLKAMNQDLPETAVFKKRELILIRRALRRRALTRGLRAAIHEESAAITA